MPDNAGNSAELPRIPTVGQASLAAETLVAITGIFPSRGPNELEAKAADARNYSNRIRRRITKFLEAKDGPELLKWSPPPSQKSLWQQLHEQVDIAEVGRWFARWEGDPAVGVEYMAVVSAARERIKQAWPQFQDTSLGLHHFELSEDEYGDVWHLCRTLNDPETIFDDMDSLVLLPVQVEAVSAIYPQLYQQIVGMTMLLLQPYAQVGDEPAPKNLLAEREEQIRTLVQAPFDAPLTAQEEPKAQAQPKSQPEPKQDDSSTETPSEHIAQRRLAR